MKKEEIDIYHAIQRNAVRGITAINTISDMVYDDTFSRQITRESLKYTDIRSRVIDKLLQGKTEAYREQPFSEFMLKSNIRLNTVLNTSTGRMAELMIQNSNKCIMDMCRILNKYPDMKSQATELAKEFMDFEERNITGLKKYL